MERIVETSPRFKARMAGVCQLMEAVTAAFGEVIIPGKLVVAGNAAATAARVSPFITAASALGEIPLELWLIVMGVNVQRWKEQRSAGRLRSIGMEIP
jgi:hypothetical protein